MGTRFFAARCARSSHPSRSRAHPRRPPSFAPVLDGSGTLDDDLLATDVDLERSERPGRRARDVSPLQVVGSVVAGAPDVGAVGAKLNRAVEMRARGGE